MVKETVLRYRIFRFCRTCYKWIPRDYGFCPYCFRKSLKNRPKNQRCKERYNNSRVWSLDEAEELFEKFLEKGYYVDEAVEFVEAITGFKVDPKIAVPVKASKDAKC
jgi:predicted amidophosphoribosyltransferase